MNEVVQVKLTDIELHPDNGRDKIAMKEGIPALAESIKSTGQLVPGIGRKLTNGKIQLVAGRRRYEAMKLLKTGKMSIDVREMTDLEALEIMVTENLQRQGMTVPEEIKEIKKLVKLGVADKRPLEIISQRLGRPMYWVKRAMAISKLANIELDAISEALKFVPSIDLLAYLSALSAEDRVTALDNIGYKASEDEAFKRLRRSDKDLTKAPFDTAACLKCRHNTGTQPGLFDNNTSELASCKSEQCFWKKHQAVLAEQIRTLAIKKPDEPFYVAINHDQDVSEFKFPANVKCVEGYAMNKKDDGQIKAFVFAISMQVEPGKFGYVWYSENKPEKKPKTAAALKDAPITKQIEAKEESLKGLRLKLIGEYLKEEFNAIKYPAAFMTYSDSKKLHLALNFGASVRDNQAKTDFAEMKDGEICEALWASMKKRFVEYVSCQTGTSALLKEDNIQHACKLAGMVFEDLMAKAKKEKPDPKSLVTLLEAKELNIKSEKKRAKK